MPTSAGSARQAVDAPRIVTVMGPTGAGKSTFIRIATGVDVHVGHGLVSDTQVVRPIKCRDPFQDRDFLLLDTPGFDDTCKSDGKILAEIARWLSKTYKDGVKLSGILYLHRITDNRMTNSLIQNLDMLKKLCGEDAFSNIIFVTTHWGQYKEDDSSRVKREGELRDNYWKSFLSKKSQMLRFEDTGSSAWSIINALPDVQKLLKIQQELVDEDKLLSETSAGRPLYSWLGHMSQSLERHIGWLNNLAQLGSRNSASEKPEWVAAKIARAEADRRQIEDQKSWLSRRLWGQN